MWYLNNKSKKKEWNLGGKSAEVCNVRTVWELWFDSRPWSWVWLLFPSEHLRPFVVSRECCPCLSEGDLGWECTWRLWLRLVHQQSVFVPVQFIREVYDRNVNSGVGEGGLTLFPHLWQLFEKFVRSCRENDVLCSDLKAVYLKLYVCNFTCGPVIFWMCLGVFSISLFFFFIYHQVPHSSGSLCW